MIDVKVLHRLTDVSWHVLQLESCSSTMDYLQSLAPQLGVTEPGLIVAERQTSGRGRQGRIWNETVSALYMTLVFCLPDKPLDLSGYSLVAGCALQAVLERRGALTLLKWPNDILDAQGKKLGGILIEMTTVLGRAVVSTGIGVNLTEAPKSVERAGSLHDLGVQVGNEELAVELASQLWEYWGRFQEYGFSSFHSQWHQHAYKLGGWMKIDTGQGIEEGSFEGVSERGLLQLGRGRTRVEIVSGHVLEF